MLPTQTIGVHLRTNDPFGIGLSDPARLAARCEELCFEGAWIGDHLAFRTPWLDATVAMAAAATATRELLVGHAVLLAAMRPAAWVAKLVSSMSEISGGRYVFGVGVGGENPEEWDAVGVPTRERGRRTNELLEALPHLLAGRPWEMATEGVHIPALAPPTPMPSVVVGGRSDAALARTVAAGDMWLGAFVDLDRMVRANDRIAELASEAGRAAPPVTGLTFITSVGADAAAADEQARRYVESNYQAAWEQVRRYAVVGEHDDVVSQLATFWQAGLRHIVLQPAGEDPLRELEALAAVRESLLDAVGPSGG